jgi:hypothetical protein
MLRRTLIIIGMTLAALCAPVALFTYAWALRLLAEEIGMGWFAVAMVFHVTAWVGLGFLIDNRQGRWHL